MKQNKKITKVVEIAKEIGLDVFTDEYTDLDTNQELVSIQFRDEDSGLIVSINVTPDASKKDISNELYLLTDELNGDSAESNRIKELKEEYYTDDEIDTMRRYINFLYKYYTFS